MDEREREHVVCGLIRQRWFVWGDDLALFWEIIDSLLAPSSQYSYAELIATAERLINTPAPKRANASGAA